MDSKFVVELMIEIGQLTQAELNLCEVEWIAEGINPPCMISFELWI